MPLATAERNAPKVVVQADVYNHRLRHAVVVEITGNLAEADDPACLLMDSSTPAARAAGLSRDFLISCCLLTLTFARQKRSRFDHGFARSLLP
jgi:hypothetical protein